MVPKFPIVGPDKAPKAAAEAEKNMPWLRGWKQICSYTGYCQKTMKSWMINLGFPVFYINGMAIASTLAIEKWLAERLKKPVEPKKSNLRKGKPNGNDHREG